MPTKQLQLFVRRVHDYEAPGVVDAVFGGMSEESRRLRFLVPMPRLPASVRRQLSTLRGSSHAAFGAWVDGRAVGFGQLARISDSEAEVGIAVADDFHNLGIGRRLLIASAELAADLGYRELSADALAENAPMLHLLCEVFPDARISQSQGVIHVACPLGEGALGPVSRAAAQPWRREHAAGSPAIPYPREPAELAGA